MTTSARTTVLLAATLALAGAASAQPVQVGEAVAVTVNSPHPYLPDGADGPAWRHVFRRDRASYVAVHFARFALGPGDRLVVSHPDGLRAVEYTGRGKQGLGTFWATHIPGDTAVVELYATPSGGGFGVEIDQVAYGYPPERMPALGADSLCGTDDQLWAQCFEETEPAVYERGRSVARLLINGVGACTGWLVGCEGHLMTNNHCIETQSDASNTDYELMAERSCATGCGFWWACPGDVVASSGTLVQTDPGLDFSLIEPPTDPTPTYGFLTLRSSGAELGERIYLVGHPNGWGKRVSLDSDHPTDPADVCTVSSMNEPGCTGGPPELGYFCDTQGGNSGSPVLAYSDHRVVALHHCGSCPNRGVAIEEIVDALGVELPECALDLNMRLTPPAPARAGTANSMTAIGATPGERVYLVLSPREGTTAVPGCPGVSVELAGARVLTNGVVDAEGNAVLDFEVPPAMGGRTAFLQAVETGTCTVSNRVEASFQIAGPFVVADLAHRAAAGSPWPWGYVLTNGGAEPADVELTIEQERPDGTTTILEGPLALTLAAGESLDEMRETTLGTSEPNGPHVLVGTLVGQATGEFLDEGSVVVELRGGAAAGTTGWPLAADGESTAAGLTVAVEARVERGALWSYLYVLTNATDESQTVRAEVLLTDPSGATSTIEGPRTYGIGAAAELRFFSGYFVGASAPLGLHTAQVRVLDTDGNVMSESETESFRVVEASP